MGLIVPTTLLPLSVQFFEVAQGLIGAQCIGMVIRMSLQMECQQVGENVMAEATMFEAKTQLSNLVKRAQRGEKVILTSGRKRTPVAMIVALKPVKERVFDLFHQPDFDIPAEFDDLPEAELRAWSE